MTDFSAFGKMVPGFDFLQGLAQNANAVLPGMGQWVAPTLDPAELEKRINELRTVQFWLEQNVRMVDTTIRALEVQRMTLSTLKTMNVRVDDLRNALKIPVPTAPVMAAPAAPPNPFARAPAPAPAAPPVAAPDPDAPPAPGAVDPLQWWGALTQQFTELASNAMRESAAQAARQIAGAGLAGGGEAAGRKGGRKPAASPKPGGRGG